VSRGLRLGRRLRSWMAAAAALEPEVYFRFCGEKAESGQGESKKGRGDYSFEGSPGCAEALE
jgi:hypothetical protein